MHAFNLIKFNLNYPINNQLGLQNNIILSNGAIMFDELNVNEDIM